MSSIATPKHRSALEVGLKNAVKKGGNFAFYFLVNRTTRQRLLHVDPKAGLNAARFKNPLLINKHLTQRGFRAKAFTKAELKKYRSLCGIVAYSADDAQLVFTVGDTSGMASDTDLEKGLKDADIKKALKGVDWTLGMPTVDDDGSDDDEKIDNDSDDGLQGMWQDAGAENLLEQIWTMIGESSSNIATTNDAALALHPDVLEDLEAYSMVIDRIERYQAHFAGLEVDFDSLTEVNINAMLGPLKHAYAEVMWGDASLNDQGQLQGLGNTVTALVNVATVEEAEIARNGLANSGLDDGLIGRMSTQQIIVVKSILNASAPEAANALLLGLQGVSDDDKKALKELVKKTFKLKAEAAEKRDKLLKTMLSDQSLFKSFKKATRAWGSRDELLVALGKRIDTLGKSDPTSATYSEIRDMLETSRKARQIGDVWLDDPDRRFGKRGPGVLGAMDALSTIEGLSVAQYAGFKLPKFEDIDMGVMQQILRFTITLVYRDGVTGDPANMAIDREFIWENPALASRAETATDGFKSILQRIKEDVGGTVDVIFRSLQPTTHDAPSFTKSATYSGWGDVGPLLYFAGKLDENPDASLERMSIELCRHMKERMTTATREQQNLDSYEQNMEGFTSVMSQEPTDDRLLELKTKVDDFKKRLGDFDPGSEYDTAVNTKRRGDSETIGKGDDNSPGVRNWKKAEETIRSLIASDEPLKMEDILGINKVLGKGMDDHSHPGQLRTEQEFSGFERAECMYIPPDNVEGEMGKLFTWVNQELAKDDFNPIYVAAKAQQWFVSIHPFSDGNGRTSRLLSDYILGKGGLPPCIMGKMKLGVFGAKEHHGRGKGDDALDYAIRSMETAVERAVKLLE